MIFGGGAAGEAYAHRPMAHIAPEASALHRLASLTSRLWPQAVACAPIVELPEAVLYLNEMRCDERLRGSHQDHENPESSTCRCRVSRKLSLMGIHRCPALASSCAAAPVGARCWSIV
jgi:hypothetical protein